MTGEVSRHVSGTETSTVPSLTRAFLFADLRDYTRLVETHGASRAAELLERYRVLVRDAVGRFGGAEIKTEGDSFYVVFDSVSAAVQCGLAILFPMSRPPLNPFRTRAPDRGPSTSA